MHVLMQYPDELRPYIAAFRRCMPSSTTGDSCSSLPFGHYARLQQAQRQHGSVLVYSQHDEPSYSCISACWYDDGCLEGLQQMSSQ